MGTSTRPLDILYSITSLMSLLCTHSGHQARVDSITVTLAHQSHWFSVYRAALLVFECNASTGKERLCIREVSHAQVYRIVYEWLQRNRQLPCGDRVAQLVQVLDQRSRGSPVRFTARSLWSVLGQDS